MAFTCLLFTLVKRKLFYNYHNMLMCMVCVQLIIYYFVYAFRT